MLQLDQPPPFDILYRTLPLFSSCASTHELHLSGHGNVLSAHFKSYLYTIGIEDAYVASRLEASCNAQVVLQLAFLSAYALQAHPHRQNVCTCTLTFLSETPLHRTVQSVCLLKTSFLVHSQVGPAAVTPSFSRHLQPHKTT